VIRQNEKLINVFAEGMSYKHIISSRLYVR